jgi:hypothetical protein
MPKPLKGLKSTALYNTPHFSFVRLQSMPKTHIDIYSVFGQVQTGADLFLADLQGVLFQNLFYFARTDRVMRPILQFTLRPLSATGKYRTYPEVNGMIGLKARAVRRGLWGSICRGEPGST